MKLSSNYKKETKIVNQHILDMLLHSVEEEASEILVDDFFLKDPLFFNYLEKILKKGKSIIIYSSFNIDVILLGKILSFSKNFILDPCKLRFLVDLNPWDIYDEGNKLNCINNIYRLEAFLKKEPFNNTSLIYSLNLKEINPSLFDELNNLNKVLSPKYLRLRFIPKQDISYKEHIHNLKWGDFIVDILKYGERNNMQISFDCCLYPCMFSEKSLAYLNSKNYFVEEGNSIFKFKCPSDVFEISSEEKGFHCPPLKEETLSSLYMDPFTLTPDFSKIKEEVSAKFQNIREKSLPLECLSCVYRLTSICKGMCPAFFIRSR